MWSKEPISLILSVSVSLNLMWPLSEYPLFFTPALPHLSSWGACPHDVTHYIPYRNMFLLPKSFFLTRKLMTTSSLSFSFRKGTHRWSGWPAWDHTAQRSHVGESKSSAFCLEGVTDPRNTPSFWRIGPRGALQDQLAMPWFSLACLQRVSGWSGFSDTHTPHPGISCIVSGHYPSERWNWKGQV